MAGVCQDLAENDELDVYRKTPTSNFFHESSVKLEMAGTFWQAMTRILYHIA